MTYTYHQERARIEVMDTCCVCGKLEVITTNRIYQDQMCYKCERILYRLRAGADIRTEDLARAERAKAFIDRKTAGEFRIAAGREA